MVEWLSATIGSAIGSFIGVIGAILIAYFKIRSEKKKEQTEQFYKLIALMYEIKRNIKRCEFFLSERINKNKISFSTILSLTYKSHWSRINLSELDIEVYINIERIYHLFEFVVYNIEKANVLEIDIKKKTHTQRNIIHEYRYNVAIAFIMEYLRDCYEKYNEVYNHVLKYSNNKKIEISKSIKKDLEKYSKDYVINQVEKFQLKGNILY